MLSKIILSLALLSTVTPADARGPTDWALLTITAGAQGATHLSADLSAEADALTDVPIVIGAAASDPTNAPSMFVEQATAGSTMLTTTKTLGGFSFTVLAAPGGGATIASQNVWDDLAPGQQVALLVFATGAMLDPINFRDPTWSGGSASYKFTFGSGATAVDLVSSDGDGFGTSLGRTGVGTSSSIALPSSGIVGGFPVDFCTGVCSVSWSGPDPAASGSVAFIGTKYADLPGSPATFAGGPGQWTWSWTGASVGDPTTVGPLGRAALAAFAPIGGPWTLFAPPSP